MMALLSNKTPCICRGFVLYSHTRGVENLFQSGIAPLLRYFYVHSFLGVLLR
nr:MAG TPA: hypothetical protein [Caudoviricetes sp.]